MSRKKGSRFAIFYALGRQILLVSKKQNWNWFLEVLLEAYGAAPTLIGYIWVPRVLPVVSFSCGIEGWWKS